VHRHYESQAYNVHATVQRLWWYTRIETTQLDTWQKEQTAYKFILRLNVFHAEYYALCFATHYQIALLYYYYIAGQIFILVSSPPSQWTLAVLDGSLACVDSKFTACSLRYSRCGRNKHALHCIQLTPKGHRCQHWLSLHSCSRWRSCCVCCLLRFSLFHFTFHGGPMVYTIILN